MITGKSLKDRLRAFIENIELKQVRLYNTEFKLNRINQEEESGAEVKLSIIPKLADEQEIVFYYTHRERISLKENELRLKIVYALIVDFYGNKEELKKNTLVAYAKNTGLLVVYPYIRHTSDILKREAGFLLPPLPHVLIK